MFLLKLPAKVLESSGADAAGLYRELEPIEGGVAQALGAFILRIPLAKTKLLFDKLHRWARAKRAYVCGPIAQPGEEQNVKDEVVIDCVEATRACFFWKLFNALVTRGQDVIA